MAFTPTLTRKIKDELKRVTTTLPAAGATANGASIDLGPTPLTDDVQFYIGLPALANLADTKTMTGTIQDSADDSSFTAVAGLDTIVLTGAGGVGAAAANKTQRIPLTIRRYARVAWVAVASAGDSTASKGEFSLVF